MLTAIGRSSLQQFSICTQRHCTPVRPPRSTAPIPSRLKPSLPHRRGSRTPSSCEPLLLSTRLVTVPTPPLLLCHCVGYRVRLHLRRAIWTAALDSSRWQSPRDLRSFLRTRCTLPRHSFVRLRMLPLDSAAGYVLRDDNDRRIARCSCAQTLGLAALLAHPTDSASVYRHTLTYHLFPELS
jgi:hypothetical protein